MGHLLGYQRELGITSVNYGPEVDAAFIRESMPEAIINGHTPPFLLRNGSADEIKARVMADFHKVGRDRRADRHDGGVAGGGYRGGPDALVHAVGARALPVRSEVRRRMVFSSRCQGIS